MANEDEILELKFEGNKVNPETIKPHEVADLITNFERALISTIKQNNPEINTEHLLISFHSIENKSLDLKFKKHTAKEIVLSAFTLISTSIATSNYKNLNSDTVESLKEITKFTKRHDCVGSFRYKNTALTTFSKNTEVYFDKSNELKGETRVYAKVLRVGGETPTALIKIDEEYRISVDLKEELAKKLATKLYETVGLYGVATWDIKSYKVIDFRVHEIVEIENKPINKTFEELRDIIGEHWDKIDDISSIIG